MYIATEIRYNDAETREYTQCDGSGEDWSDWYCYYYTTSIDDHLNYFDIYLTCDDDEADEVLQITTVTPETTATTNVGDKIVYKFKEGLNGLPEAAKWAIFIALGLGWILALVFCCCYYKARGELKERYKYGADAGSYYAFNTEHHSL